MKASHIVLPLLIPLCLLSCTFFHCGRTVTILSYNVNNLFDDIENGTEYREFNPSYGKWDSHKFHARLHNIAEAIKRSTASGPDIVCLQEVENQYTLDTLNNGYLKSYNYLYAFVTASPKSAVNTGILSRFPVSSIHVYNMPNDDDHGLRDILEIEIHIDGKELHLFNNHWKSKSGGQEITEHDRLEASGILLKRTRSLLKEDTEADIIILGDLNENSDEYEQVKGKYQTALIPDSASLPESYFEKSILLSPAPSRCGVYGKKIVLYETWYSMPPEKRGNYVYRHTWQTPDHILISKTLFDESHYTYCNFSVIKFQFLLDPATGYPLAGEDTGKVYSDHLPLLLTLSLK